MERELQAKVKENEEFLQKLRSRQCRDNIRRYKEEMDYFKTLMNPYNVTMSSANIEQKVDKILKKEESDPKL